MEPLIRTWLPWLRVVASALFVLSAASGVAADDRSPRQQYGDIHLGPLFLSLRASVSAGVDTNVYNEPSPIGDESVTVTPTLQAVLPITRHFRIRGTGSVVPHYFYKQASQRHVDLLGSARAEADFGRLTVFGGRGSARYRQRFSLEIDERLERRESTYLVGCSARAGRRLRLTGSRTHATATFDPLATLDGNLVSTSLDRESVTYSFELSVPLTRKTFIVPAVDLVDDRFTHSQPALNPRIRSDRYFARMEFGELAFMTGRIAVGLRHFGGGQGVGPYNGLFLSAGIDMPFVLETRLQLSTTRDVSYSATLLDKGIRNTYIDGRYQATVSFELPLRLHGNVSAAYAEANYLLPSEAESGSSPRRDHVWTEGGALLRHFGRHVSLGLMARYGNRVSSLESRRYRGTLYGVTGEVRF